MRRVLIGVLLLAGCGESAPAAPSSTVAPTPPPSIVAPPPSIVVAPAPSTVVASAVPEGAPVHGAAAIEHALEDIEGHDAGARSIVPSRWLWIDEAGASCMSGAPIHHLDPLNGDIHLTCDDASTRCIDTELGVALVLRPGTRGPYLHAIVSYGETVPSAETGARARVLEQRDEICAALDAVRSSAPPIDPRGLVWGSPDAPHLVCGPAGLAPDDLRCESAIDAAGQPRANVSCEATCWVEPYECGVTRILLRRSGGQGFTIFAGIWLASDERETESSALVGPSSAFLAAHTCGAPAGTSASSRARRALCELLQVRSASENLDEDGDGEIDDVPAIPGITVANGVLSVSAADTRESYCTDAIAAVDRDRVCDELRCDDGGTRCVFGNDVFLLHAQPAAAELFAVIHYPSTPPATEEGRVATVIERRDHVCELFTMVRSGTLRIDPHGFASPRGDGLTRECGADALTAAHAAVDELLAGQPISCSQSDCRRAGEDRVLLLARRDAQQHLGIYGRYPSTTEAAHFLDADPCGP